MQSCLGGWKCIIWVSWEGKEGVIMDNYVFW